MASQPYTGLETHPDGTTGVAGIVNGNWERLELLFNPAIDSADAAYQAFLKALARTPTLPSTNGATVQWDEAATPRKMLLRAGYSAPAATATPAVDFKGPLIQDFTLNADATFSGTNVAAGWQATAFVRAGGSLRNLTFPAWVFVGSATPTTLASGKIAVLEVWASGTSSGSVLARWTVQP